MALKPDLLSQVKGHAEVISRLKKAARRRLAPTLLLVGPSGVGKRRVARGLAQLLVCEKGREAACGLCGPCVRVAKGQSEAVLEIEPQGASVKLEQARQVLKFIELTLVGRARVVIINEAHLMNAQAANCLLKSLEEPPPQTWFILIAPTASAILPTLRSRSQIIRFGTLPKHMVAELARAEPWALESAMGRMDLLDELSKEGVATLRETAFAFWRGEDVDLHKALDSRESALWVARFWQGLLRDGWFFKKSLTPLIHADQQDLIERMSALSEERLATLSRDVLRLESDIQHNADYHLAFENFVRNQLHGTLD